MMHKVQEMRFKLRWWRYLAPSHWHTWLGLGLLWFVGRLPMPLIAILGSAMGMLLYALFPVRRRVVYRNISASFPELSNSACKRLSRTNYRQTGQSILSNSIAWWASEKRLDRLVSIKGKQYLDEADNSGRPIILLVGHFVALEMGGLYLARQPIIDIYRKPRNRLLNELLLNRRKRWGTATVCEIKEGLKPVIRAMKKGARFYYLPDQDFGRRRSIFVPFMGIQTATIPAMSRLCRITNAIVLPCYTRLLPMARGFEIVIRPALKDYPSGDDYADAVVMNQAIETMVREAPDQYFWLHKRFKTRPEGETPFYQDA